MELPISSTATTPTLCPSPDTRANNTTSDVSSESVVFGDFNLTYFYHCIETCIDKMPLMRTLFPKEKTPKCCEECYRKVSSEITNGTFIFGGFLRWLFETNGKANIDEFITSGDIDIYCKNNYVFMEFIKNVVARKGYIEYFGNQYGINDDDIGDIGGGRQSQFKEIVIDESTENVPNGNYAIYMPYGEGWIKYDVTFDVSLRSNAFGMFRDKLDFTVNGLTYPIVDFKKFQFALADIKRMRIQPHDITRSPKYVYRAKKLMAKGYKFDSDKTCGTLVAYLKGRNDIKSSIYVGNTNIPSMIDGIHNIIRQTNHKNEPITWESVMLDDTMRKMCDTTFIDFYLDNRIGTLSKDLIVYKGAYIGKARPQSSVVVCLRVKKGTKYHCGTIDDGIKLRFESAFVESVYSYPDVEIDTTDVVIRSSYDSKFFYKVGEIVKPTYTFSEEHGACRSGIHAFFNLETAWRYFSLGCASFTESIDKCTNVANFLCDFHNGRRSLKLKKESLKKKGVYSPVKSVSPSISPKKTPKKDEPKSIFYNLFSPLASLKKK